MTSALGPVSGHNDSRPGVMSPALSAAEYDDGTGQFGRIDPGRAGPLNERLCAGIKF